MYTPIAVAGVGDLGKYIVEELQKSERYQVLVIARKSNPWLQLQRVNTVISDYTEESILQALNDSGAECLISTINCDYDQYFPLHNTMLKACIKSTKCKRFIPGEYAGNLHDYPSFPRDFAASRQPFRELLQQSTGVEWTIFNCGWLMDYLLPASKTHIHPISFFPVDTVDWRATLLGTGNEPQSWTCARNIGQALVELLGAREWEPITYVAGEWGTFNNAVMIMEDFYGESFAYHALQARAHTCGTEGRSMPVERKSADSAGIGSTSDGGAGPGTTGEITEVQEWMLVGASACPCELTLQQRRKYFGGVDFLTIGGLLRHAQGRDFV